MLRQLFDTGDYCYLKLDFQENDSGCEQNPRQLESFRRFWEIEKDKILNYFDRLCDLRDFSTLWSPDKDITEAWETREIQVV